MKLFHHLLGGNKSHLLRGLFLAMSVITVLSGLTALGLLDRFEWQSYDLRNRVLRKGTQLPSDVAVILVDDTSLKALDRIAGRWPWPRSMHADLIEYLGYANPKAVLFDIDFWEKQRVPGVPGEFISPHDHRLVEATLEYPYVYHAINFTKDTEEIKTQSSRLPPDFVAKFALENQYKLTNLDDHPNNGFQIPFTELYRAASGVGAVNIAADDDGVYRRVRLWHQLGSSRFPSLGFAPVLPHEKMSPLSRSAFSVKVGNTSIPLDESDRFLIKFYDSNPGFSYSGVIASLQAIRSGDFEKILINPEEFTDKIVYVGASASGLNDLINTPFTANLPGVYLHASVAANIIKNDFLRVSPSWITYLLVALLAGVTVHSILRTQKFSIQTGIPVLMLSAWVAMSFTAQFFGVVIPLVAPGLAIILSAIGMLALLLLTEGREKRKIKRMMSQYLSPAVLDTVVNNPQEILRAEVGSNEQLTILFSDIRGFTSMSEILSAEKVVEILNHYFSEMTGIIFKHEGTIDKFIGDAIMSFWGAPIRIADHADRAVSAAMQMLRQLQDVNQWLLERHYPKLEMGIGLNTGNVVLGNIGSEHKLEYTAIGDNVNLASRMEGLTKQYGCGLLISESTYQALQHPMPCRLIDLVRVKGKKQPIRIYQPLFSQTTDEPLDYLKKIAGRHEELFGHYLARRWDEALAVLAKLPDDVFKKIMTERCHYFKANPPGEVWDGVNTLTSK